MPETCGLDHVSNCTCASKVILDFLMVLLAWTANRFACPRLPLPALASLRPLEAPFACDLPAKLPSKIRPIRFENCTAQTQHL